MQLNGFIPASSKDKLFAWMEAERSDRSRMSFIRIDEAEILGIYSQFPIFGAWSQKFICQRKLKGVDTVIVNI